SFSQRHLNSRNLLTAFGRKLVNVSLRSSADRNKGRITTATMYFCTELSDASEPFTNHSASRSPPWVLPVRPGENACAIPSFKASQLSHPHSAATLIASL